MNPVSQEMGPCPCGSGYQFEGNGCGIVGTKLTKYGHLVGCTCRSCLGRRVQKKGKANQAKGHRALGGTGFTPSHEESRSGYPIRVQVEHKGGYPEETTMFRQFIVTAWFKHALRQAEKALTIGDGALPSVMIDGRWLIVDCKRIGPDTP